MHRVLASLLALPVLTLGSPYGGISERGAGSSHQGSSSSPFSALSEADALAIRNTINTYATAVDSKNSTLLASLFTSDASASFTDPDQTVVGGAAIAAHDLYPFAGLNTFHDLSTQTLAVLAKGSVEATTYFAATVFGKDCYAGQIVTAYGSYLDTLTEANGSWAISGRQQVYANPEVPYIGKAAIVLGPACNSTSS